MWHMPHGIFFPHSAPRSSNAFSLLCYPSASLQISTATGPSCNIGTYRNILFARYHNVFSSIRTPTFFFLQNRLPCESYAIFFITEMRFCLGIALAGSAHPQEQIKSRQECPTSSQKKYGADQRPFLLFFLSPMVMHISIPPSHYEVHSLQRLLFFCKPNCLTLLMHLLPGQLRTVIYFIKQIAISSLTRNSTKSCTHLMSPKRPAQLSYGVITQPPTASAGGGNVAYNEAAVDSLHQYRPCS